MTPNSNDSEQPGRSVYQFSVKASYKTSKINEKISDCQDSYGLSTDKLGIAISDGATQSFYSGQWAEILCHSYCSWPKPLTPQCWTDWLSAAQVEWIKSINRKLVDLREAGKPSWIECLNGIELKKDAFATFIGMHLEGLYIRGIAIGDSCGLLIKHSITTTADAGQSDLFDIVRAFPGLWKHSFSNKTIGLSSYAKRISHAPEFFDVPVPQDGESYLVLLATDALAEYILKKEAEGSSAICDLISLENEEQFFEYVSSAREQGLANDDTTLVVASITSRVTGNESPESSTIARMVPPQILATQVYNTISSDREEHLAPLQPSKRSACAITTNQPEGNSESSDSFTTERLADFSSEEDSVRSVTGYSETISQDLVSPDRVFEKSDRNDPDMIAPSTASLPPILGDAHSGSSSVRNPMTHSEVSLPNSFKKKIVRSPLGKWLRRLLRYFLSDPKNDS